MRTAVSDVLSILLARTSPLASEAVPVVEAAGRVLAGAVVSPTNIPRFPRAAMDGYAVRASDTTGATPDQPKELSLLGASKPARPFVGAVGPNQAVAVATGSPLPEGADAVVVQESVSVEADCVRVREAVASGRHVSRVGEDVSAGREVLRAGRRLRPQDVGLLAALGLSTVDVVRRPRVSTLVTGDELLPSGSPVDGASIIDSNSPMLAALTTRDGGHSLATTYVADDRSAIRAAIMQAVESSDVILATGGSSVGPEDHTPPVAAELGELPIHGIAMRPGGPAGIAFLLRPSSGTSGAKVPLFLLPGNPVACLCAYDLFAGRVIRRLGGRAWELPYRKVSLPLASDIISGRGRTDYLRVRVESGRAVPIAISGASILSSTVFADGFVLVPAEREKLTAGEKVEVWLYG